MDTGKGTDKPVMTYRPIEKKPVSLKIILLVVIVLIALAGITAGGIALAVNNIQTDAAKASSALIEDKSSEASDVDIADSLRTSTVDRVIENETIPAYTVSQVMQMDVSQPSGVTVDDLKQVTQGGLVGLEEAFYNAEQNYGINCLFVMAIAAHESANGTACFKPNNMFGFGSRGFSSKAECIDVVARSLEYDYLTPGASLYSGKTISAVNRRYASSSTWDDRVASNMAKYYSTISSYHNAALEKLK